MNHIRFAVKKPETGEFLRTNKSYSYRLGTTTAWTNSPGAIKLFNREKDAVLKAKCEKAEVVSVEVTFG